MASIQELLTPPSSPGIYASGAESTSLALQVTRPVVLGIRINLRSLPPDAEVAGVS